MNLFVQVFERHFGFFHGPRVEFATRHSSSSCPKSSAGRAKIISFFPRLAAPDSVWDAGARAMRLTVSQSAP
jgi:hypothetical protein